MLAALLITSSLAFADTYTTEFQIIGPPPPSTSETIIQLKIFDGVASTYSDTTVTSSWSYITCSVDDGDVHVRFEATPSTWPSSWPSTVTCSGGGETLNINLTAAAHNIHRGDKMVDLQNGITITAPNPVTHVEFVYELPDSYDYEGGSMSTTLNGSSWSGVECQVGFSRTSKTPHLMVSASDSAQPGVGACVLSLENGADLSVPLHFTM